MIACARVHTALSLCVIIKPNFRFLSLSLSSLLMGFFGLGFLDRRWDGKWDSNAHTHTQHAPQHVIVYQATIFVFLFFFSSFFLCVRRRSWAGRVWICLSLSLSECLRERNVCVCWLEGKSSISFLCHARRMQATSPIICVVSYVCPFPP